MTQERRLLPLARIVTVLALAAFAPGCTALDDYLPGTPFTPDQPSGEVTVVGGINADRVEQSTADCSAGGTLFWGTAQNSGDVVVDDVFIEIDAFAADGALLGSFRTNVFNGEVIPADPEVEGSFDVASTSLAVDQSGSFNVCTHLAYGSVARTDYRTDFIVIEESGD